MTKVVSNEKKKKRMQLYYEYY